MIVFWLPVVLENEEKYPTEVLPIPVVLLLPAMDPRKLFPPPVVSEPEPLPKNEFPDPIIFSLPALSPTKVFPPPVVFFIPDFEPTNTLPKL